MSRPSRFVVPLLAAGLLLTGCTTTADSQTSPGTESWTEPQTFAGSTSTEAPTSGSGSSITITGSSTPSSGESSAGHSPAPSPRSQRPTPTTTPTQAEGSSGLDTCELDTLPDEVADTVDDIEAGGPYVARKDGTTFGNRERLLPNRQQGFYREYTVITPGSGDRGARRIVTGGDPKTDPEWMFYTDDHYDSFCEITGR